MSAKNLLLAALASAFLASSANAESAQQCMGKMMEFEAYAKKEGPKGVPKGEAEAFLDFAKIPIYDAKLLCMIGDMDGAFRTIYQKVCPQTDVCGKMKVLVDRGLTAQEKQCIESVIKNDFINMPNTEMKRTIYLTYSPEVIFAGAVAGDRCTHASRQ
jgi:hypothetical protein